MRNWTLSSTLTLDILHALHHCNHFANVYIAPTTCTLCNVRIAAIHALFASVVCHSLGALRLFEAAYKRCPGNPNGECFLRLRIM